jgi:hypothetical protein
LLFGSAFLTWFMRAKERRSIRTARPLYLLV